MLHRQTPSPKRRFLGKCLNEPASGPRTILQALLPHTSETRYPLREPKYDGAGLLHKGWYTKAGSARNTASTRRTSRPQSTKPATSLWGSTTFVAGATDGRFGLFAIPLSKPLRILLLHTDGATRRWWHRYWSAWPDDAQPLLQRCLLQSQPPTMLCSPVHIRRWVGQRRVCLRPYSQE